MHTMLCETGSGSKHKAYIEAISCNLDSLHEHVSGLTRCFQRHGLLSRVFIISLSRRLMFISNRL